MTETMKVVAYHKFGPPEVLQVEERPKPTPKANEILIRNVATSIHIGDTKMRSLENIPCATYLFARLYLGVFSPRRSVLGMECSGVVEEVGADVKPEQFAVGDRVFCSTFKNNFASYAEYKCMPADGWVVKMPDNVSFEEAAVTSNGGMTAYSLLRKSGVVKNGSKVLIYGASGSVGSFAAQLAVAMGATVTGVCSTPNVDAVRQFGCASVLDYTNDDFRDQISTGEKYNLVFDCVGKMDKSLAKSALLPDGVFFDVNKDEESSAGVADLQYLSSLMASGQLKPHIDSRTFHLFEDVVEGHRYAEQGHKKGNIVMHINASD